jgi:hypothetical protein
VFFETPCVEWILRNRVIWDFFYEHCSYFSASSLQYAFEVSGFEVDTVSHVFGGQYLWLEARAGKAEPADAHGDPAIASLADAFGHHEAEMRRELRGFIERLRGDGPVAIWGAAAKGVTLAGLTDPDEQIVACVVDLNPNKQGRYLPGTGHPIVAPRGMAAFDVKTAVLTNPNYFHENAAIVRDAGLDVRLVDLMRSKLDAD